MESNSLRSLILRTVHWIEFGVFELHPPGADFDRHFFRIGLVQHQFIGAALAYSQILEFHPDFVPVYLVQLVDAHILKFFGLITAQIGGFMIGFGDFAFPIGDEDRVDAFLEQLVIALVCGLQPLE